MKKLIVILLCSCGVDYAAMPYPDAGAPDAAIEADAGELPWCCNAFCYGTDPMECKRSWYDVCGGGSTPYCSYKCEKDATGMPTGRGWEECSLYGGFSGEFGKPNCKCRTEYWK